MSSLIDPSGPAETAEEEPDNKFILIMVRIILNLALIVIGLQAFNHFYLLPKVESNFNKSKTVSTCEVIDRGFLTVAKNGDVEHSNVGTSCGNFTLAPIPDFGFTNQNAIDIDSILENGINYSLEAAHFNDAQYIISATKLSD